MSDVDNPDDRSPDEATPAEVSAPKPPAPAADFGLHDSGWAPEQWLELLESFVKAGFCTWKDIAALVLGHLNPSQVGTSLASSEGFKRKYGKGNTMQIVMRWAYAQVGRCVDCGTRLELQADHIRGREQYADPLEADFIENMTLRCRRCNVIRRPSHEYGGLTFLTAEAALMWILLVIRPRTLRDYIRMCRLYGMTMSDIRMQEAWSMAHWLARADPPAYGIEDDLASSYDILLWPNSAVTRVDHAASIPAGATKFCERVPGAASLAFVAVHPDGRARYHEQPLAFIPFSTYELGLRPPNALCLLYSPPDREHGRPQVISDLPPSGTTLIAHQIKLPGQTICLTADGNQGAARENLGDAPPQGRILRTRISLSHCRLIAVSAE